MRVTRKNIEGVFELFCKAIGQPYSLTMPAQPDESTLYLDYASEYGGWVIARRYPDTSETRPFGDTRRSAREMWETLYFALRTLEMIEPR